MIITQINANAGRISHKPLVADEPKAMQKMSKKRSERISRGTIDGYIRAMNEGRI